MSELPPCGLYRTAKAVGGIPAGRLVYFHNHGDPGPGVYVPAKWSHNRAQWSPQGTLVPMPFEAGSLEPLRAEGFYRVATSFYCCAKQCTKFEPEMFVQLGYNGAGRALLFVPEFVGGTLHIPEQGSVVDDTVLAELVPLQVRVRETNDDLSLPRGIMIH
jgi:hypothetical protein